MSGRTKKLAMVVAGAMALASTLHAQERPPIPAENDPRAEPSPRPTAGDAAQRAEQLFVAIRDNDPERARDFFFPREPFLVLKGIADPARYWGVLWGHYERDIHALHATVPAHATFDRFVLSRRGAFVRVREEANALPYWAARHNFVYYRVGEREERFEIRTLINWGPLWYVTHLR